MQFHSVENWQQDVFADPSYPRAAWTEDSNYSILCQAQQI